MSALGLQARLGRLEHGLHFVKHLGRLELAVDERRKKSFLKQEHRLGAVRVTDHFRHLRREAHQQFAEFLVAEELVRLQQPLVLPRRPVRREAVTVEEPACVRLLVRDDKLDELPRCVLLFAGLVDQQALPGEGRGAAAQPAVRQLPRRQRHRAPFAFEVGRELLQHFFFL